MLVYVSLKRLFEKVNLMTNIKNETLPIKYRIIIPILICISLIYTTISGDIARFFIKNILRINNGLIGSVLASFSDIVVVGLVALFALNFNFIKLLKVSGLKKDIIKPIIYSLLIFIPSFVILYFIVGIKEHNYNYSFMWGSLGGPFSEELVYRGLAIGVLVKLCNWNKFIACILPSVFFGIVHIWQGEDLTSTLGIVLITAIGGIYFGWLFLKWDFNLWPAIFMHIGMNTIWTIFALGDNAIGGQIGNINRLIIVVLGVFLSFVFNTNKVKN